MNLFEKKSIKTKDLFKKMMKENEYSYDVYFRVAVISEYLNGNEKIWRLYNKMQKMRLSQIPHIPKKMAYHKKEFINLINSFIKKGYDENFPILVNKDLFVIDGAHRIACSLFFKVREVYIITNKEHFDFIPKDYSKKWFEENNLFECIKYCEEQKKKIKEDL